ncbi:MAG TPA: hypothetical protein VK194_09530 [Candidatus Deferrimicrobium sp.]|nr:hypothetical protein [Candidatus Deferrimicrobium sp.]
MSGGFGAARVVVLLFGITLLVAGLALIAVAGGPGTVAGFWLAATGLVVMVAAVIERIRYRSEATDRSGLPAGRAGGEPPGTRLDPRFRRSDEIFTDPTSGQRMRVWLDPASGERRYVAEE